MATQTGSIDLKSQKKAHDDAEKVATNYVMTHTDNASYFHAEDSNFSPSTGDAVKITDKVEIMRGGISAAEFGTSVRVGENATGKSRTVISSDGMHIYRNVSGTDTQIAHLGFGDGIDEHGLVSAAPYFSLGERTNNSTVGTYSVAEGEETIASGWASHAEGFATEVTDTAENGHAEGNNTTVSGLCGHAEGGETVASGDYSHAEGFGTTASSTNSHAEGYYSTASGAESHASGTYTVAGYADQTVIGKYNSNQSGNLFEIGNGTSISARSNAFEVSSTGGVYAAGDINIAAGKKYKINGTSIIPGQIPFGVCSTSASTQIKTVTVSPGITELTNGLTVLVCFESSNTCAAPVYLNVNSTGAQKIKKRGSTDIGSNDAEAWYDGAVVALTYRENYGWIINDHTDAIEVGKKYKRSSTGDLDWVNQTDGDAKVIAKSALAFWNGAYAGSGSNLSKCSTGNIIGSNGGTMTGQLLTSFKTSVAMGSYGSAQTTVGGLVDEVRMSSGCSGSASIGTAYTANGVTIKTGWYNFMYMPHRSGGLNGNASGDNCNYGNLFLFGMNNTNGRFIVRIASGSIQEVSRLITSVDSPTICQACGGSSTMSLSNSTMTKVSLVSTGLVKNNTNDAELNTTLGGIKIKTAGLYKVFGSVYIYNYSATTTNQIGCYVRKASNSGEYSSATEILAGTKAATSCASGGSYDVQTPTKLIELAANDVLYLVGRCVGSTATLIPNNSATFLQVERVY